MTSTDTDETSIPVLQPRELVWRGSVVTSGYWMPFVAGSLTAAETHDRILGLWESGLRVFAPSDDGLVVLLPKSRTVRAETAPGTPLVRITPDLLSAVPVSVGDGKRLKASSGANGNGDCVALVRGGEWAVLSLDSTAVIEPAAWLDLGAVTVAGDCQSLGAPPPAVTDGLPPADFNPGESFGKVATPAMPSEMADLVASLQGLEQKSREQGPGRGIGEALGVAVLRLAGGLLRRMQPPTFARSGSADSANAARRVVVEPQSGASGGPAAKDPWEWLRWATARMAGLTGLSALLGQKQAQYLQKMLDLFERGDLEQALRHAIPLGGDTDEVLKRLPPSLFAPRPRQDLTLRPGQTAATSGLNGTADLLEHLKTLYRQSFERLEREGRIEEAAFVLAELLKSNSEAVNFLEKHRRFKIAADMAEARGLPPGWVVRLRFLAGERERAVAFARRMGAWSEAVSQLEHNPDRLKEAQALRLEWAATLARSGDYAQAIDVALPVPEARSLLLAWMGRVVDGGGVTAARMSARRLAMFADGEAEWSAEAVALLATEETATVGERRAFIAELTRPGVWKQPHAVSLQRSLAGIAVRALARDTALGAAPPPPQTQFDALLLAAADPVLKADAPALRDLAGAAPPAVRHRSLRSRSPDEPPFVVDANDTGLLPIEDAARLPSGRTLVALGEVGVRLLGLDGSVLRDWSTVPAHRLVVADSGNLALALARRGRLWRITRLDLVTGAATPWCDAEIPVFAPDCDGSLWMAALPNGGETQALAAIDLQGPPDRITTLWRTPLEEGRFVAISRSSAACVGLAVSTETRVVPFTVPPETETTVSWQRWLFEMPSITMRERYIWTADEGRNLGEEILQPGLWSGAAEPDPGGTTVVLQPDSLAEINQSSPGWFVGHIELIRQPKGKAVLLKNRPCSVRMPIAPVVANGWLVDIKASENDMPPSVTVLAHVDARANISENIFIRLRVELKGATSVRARLFAGHLTLWDDRGRVVAFDLDTGDAVSNLRLR